MADYRLDPLWLRLNFLDLAAAQQGKSFLRLITAETGWPAEEVSRVMTEYRRFLFLALRAGHPVKAPPLVERVWSLHMEHAANYWEVLSGLITERPLVAGGTTGTGVNSYADTKRSYLAVFGEEPPPDLWPPIRKGIDIGALLRRLRQLK